MSYVHSFSVMPHLMRLHALFWIPRSSRGMTNKRTFITPASLNSHPYPRIIPPFRSRVEVLCPAESFHAVFGVMRIKGVVDPDIGSEHFVGVGEFSVHRGVAVEFFTGVVSVAVQEFFAGPSPVKGKQKRGRQFYVRVQIGGIFRHKRQGIPVKRGWFKCCPWIW